MEHVQIAKLEMSDTSQPLIQIRFIGDDDVHTAQVDNDGGTSELRIILVDDSGTTNIDGNTDTTLDDVVASINAVSGWEAVRYNAPGDYDTGTDDFVDSAAASIGRDFTNYLYRDVSEVLTSALRLSSPSTGEQGKIALHRIEGAATYASGAVTVTISQDDADGEVLYRSVVAAATTVRSTILDEQTNPVVLSGPVLIEVTGSAALAACSFDVTWKPVV